MENNDVILWLSTGKLMVVNETVSLHWEHAEKGSYRISLCETLTIPSRSCRVVEVDVDIGKVTGKLDQGQVDCLVECLPTLADGWTSQTNWAEHGIDEQGSTPVKRTYQSVPLAKQKFVD